MSVHEDYVKSFWPNARSFMSVDSGPTTWIIVCDNSFNPCMKLAETSESEEAAWVLAGDGLEVYQ